MTPLHAIASAAAFVFIACSEGTETTGPAADRSVTTWLASDSAAVPWVSPEPSPTADTGPTEPPPLALALSVPGDTPAPPFEHLELVMIHGPGGGWTLQVTGHLSGLVRDPSLISWTGTASLAQGVTASSSTVYWEVPAVDQRGEMASIYHFVDLGDASDWQALICDLDGTLGQLEVQLEDLEDGRTATLRQPITLHVDPVDEPSCR